MFDFGQYRYCSNWNKEVRSVTFEELLSLLRFLSVLFIVSLSSICVKFCRLWLSLLSLALSVVFSLTVPSLVCCVVFCCLCQRWFSVSSMAVFVVFHFLCHLWLTVSSLIDCVSSLVDCVICDCMCHLLVAVSAFSWDQ